MLRQWFNGHLVDHGPISWAAIDGNCYLGILIGIQFYHITIWSGENVSVSHGTSLGFLGAKQLFGMETSLVHVAIKRQIHILLKFSLGQILIFQKKQKINLVTIS